MCNSHQERLLEGVRAGGARLCWWRRGGWRRFTTRGVPLTGRALPPTYSSDVPVSICGVAVLPGWMDRPMSPQATELRSPERAPYCTAQLPAAGLRARWPGPLRNAEK